MWKLYSARVCPFAHRTRLAVQEKGLQPELIEIDLKAIPDWYKAVSPNRKVPLLMHGEHKVWESAIINEYLEDAVPEPPLWPADPYLRARGRIGIDLWGSSVIPKYYGLMKSQEKERYPELRADLLGALEQWLELLEPDGPYALGPRVSLLDLGCYPWIERWCVLEHYRQLSLPDWPRLRTWVEAVRGREAVAREVNPPDFYIDLYKAYALPGAGVSS